MFTLVVFLFVGAIAKQIAPKYFTIILLLMGTLLGGVVGGILRARVFRSRPQPPPCPAHVTSVAVVFVLVAVEAARRLAL